MDAPTNENNDILILSFARARAKLCFAHNSGVRGEEGFCEGRVGGKSFLESLDCPDCGNSCYQIQCSQILRSNLHYVYAKQ